MVKPCEASLRHFRWLAVIHSLWLILGGALLVAIPTAIFGASDGGMIAAVGIAALAVIILPEILAGGYDLFQPLSFLALTILFGITLTGIWIAVGDPAAVFTFLQGKPPASLLGPGLLILISLIAFTAGYRVQFPKIHMGSFFGIFRDDRWSGLRLFALIAGMVTIAVVSMAVFVKEMGIGFVVLSDISAKRNIIVEGAQRKYAALGYLRLAASLIQPAFYLFMAWFSTSGRRWFSFSGAAVILIGALACVYPLMTSSRTGVLSTLIVAMMIRHYLRKPIRVRSVLWAVCAAVLVLGVMGGLRKNVNEASTLASYLSGEKLAETLVINHSFLGIAKTAAIMDAVPGKLPYEYGRTLFLWLVAPVPRSIWPEKPIITVGQIIGARVYGTGDGGIGGGIPPGFIGELYWNFGWLGAPVGMFFLGIWLKFLYHGFKSRLAVNKGALLIYISIMIPFAFFVPGGNFSASVAEAIGDSIVMAAALGFVHRR